MSDETEGCFTVLWTIENFSHCLSSYAVCLRGPVFETEIAKRSSCWMLHMSKTVFPSSTFRFSLKRIRGSSPVTYEWSTLPFFSEVTQGNSYCNEFCIGENTLIDKFRQFHPFDTLNVRCRIRHPCLKTGACLKCTAMYKVNYTWNIMDYKRLIISEKNILYQQDPLSVTLTLFKKTGKRTDKVMVNVLPNKDGQPVFASCNLSFPNHDGFVIHNNDPSKYVATIWDIKVSEEKLGISGLNIHLESLIAIEKDLHKNFPLSSRRSCLNTQPSVIVAEKSVPKVAAVSSGLLGEDLLLMYKRGSHSDATLNTNDQSFSVHKNILSSRSSVFRVMFEDDRLSESRSGIVDIDDLDSATVDRLLVYLYSDSLADMQWKEASTLYYAADKYDIQPLKTKCAEVLKAGVAASNACEALELADKHADKELMRCVVDFLSDHDEVISSDEWDKLEEINSRLTSKVMRELYLKKTRR